ncbi:MAG TPA: N-acetylmuramoyl-L-alanine amidase-like domain-containing protein [Chthoniobacterales bacterium]|nr:N-acetylmuramoyl-L-alanine amidase-like domain-containing protein [Chthoniobacterales bacterium]
MRRVFAFLIFIAIAAEVRAASTFGLPFSTVFKGEKRFDQLVERAKDGNWAALPLGERVATIGQAFVGTPYKNYTLEIDDRIEAPSANLNALDCWTFFEIALAFARMIEEPQDNWTPERLLDYIEQDRYRGGRCTGEYLSRLHYLEDWLADNDRRGLVNDITGNLGGRRVAHSAREMTVGWKSYRYLRNNPSLLRPLGQMEARVSRTPLYMIPKSRVAAIEPKLRNGDIIGIVSRDGRRGYATSHVGLALRDRDGTLRFMHASAPRNYGKVVIDSRLTSYLYRYGSHAGIMVARPTR